MRNLEFFKGKRITVIGLGRSGKAACLLLKELGSEVSITDSSDKDDLRKDALELKAKGIEKIELGVHTQGFIKGRDLVIVSPGVSDSSNAVIWAEGFRIPIISEIEFAYLLCPAKVIAITGTNGKTTVTTLIGKVIQAAGKSAFVCGNIGNPFCSQVSLMHEQDYVSLEVSSFQLERISEFRPFISVILNFTPDHLDRYKNTEDYLQAKKRIFMNQQSGDYVVLNYDDPALRSTAAEVKAEVRYFRKEAGLNPNQSAVLEVAGILGIARNICSQVFNNFKGIAHRMESVLELGGVEFINDSKATNVDSTMWALSNIHKPIVLIAGGRDKGIDYSLICELAKKKVRSLVLIGEAKVKIKSALGSLLPYREADSMYSAVETAFQNAKAGDCVLLSPMCASFDMFSNYEHRGEVFKDAVRNLAKERLHA